MKTFSFSIDKDLCINSWGKEITKLTGKPLAIVRGMKYYEVIPKICCDGKDAVHTALQEKKPVTYNGFSFNCFNGQIMTDVQIKPLAGRNRQNGGANIILTPHVLFPVTNYSQNSQRLIDIGKVASTFAHGVRNHLNVIKGVVAWLKEKYAADKTLIEFTAITEEEIAQLDSFISKFLGTSLPSSNLSYVDMDLILKKLEIFTFVQSRPRKIKTFFEYGNIPKVLGDQFQLEQAVMNVVNNAIEAMADGGSLRIKTLREGDKKDQSVVIEISDTGEGISCRKLKDFSMPQPGKKNGRGFGLFITREILNHYGGHMEIKSKKGEGTTVRLCFPVRDSADYQ